MVSVKALLDIKIHQNGPKVIENKMLLIINCLVTFSIFIGKPSNLTFFQWWLRPSKALSKMVFCFSLTSSSGKFDCCEGTLDSPLIRGLKTTPDKWLLKGDATINAQPDWIHCTGQHTKTQKTYLSWAFGKDGRKIKRSVPN